MNPDAVAEMEAFLRQRYGITNRNQLAARIRAAEKINVAIFNGGAKDDDSRGTEERGA